MSPDDPAAPPPDAILVVDPAVLAGALLSIPDGENEILRLADGRRTVAEVVAASGLDPAVASASLVRLLDAGVLRVVPPRDAAKGAGHSGPEAADWFAHPASEPEPVPLPEPPAATPPEAPPWVAPPAPARTVDGRGRSRGRLAVAAVALGALVVAGAIWAQRQRGSAPPQTRVERPALETPPPALAVTEPSPGTAYRDALLEVGARHEAGDLAGAAAACRRAIAIDPAAGAGWLALGEVSLAAGDRDRARSAFERYLAVEPGGPHAPRVRALLERLRP